MTFLTELTRLREAIATEKNPITRYGLQEQLDAHLVNHAKEIIALVEAAENVDVSLQGLAGKELHDALAALNKEQS
jgi:hypothetical protein